MLTPPEMVHRGCWDLNPTTSPTGKKGLNVGGNYKITLKVLVLPDRRGSYGQSLWPIRFTSLTWIPPDQTPQVNIQTGHF